MTTALRWLLGLSIANPVAVRIVQNGSKRSRHLYLRAGYLALLIIVLLWTLLLASDAGSLSYRQLAAAGATSFKYVAYAQVALICLITPLFMAGAIAQEANPKTWDILLSTPLTAAQIVLGNLTGRLFFVLALLFASLPLFAVTQYFGGVPGRAIFLSYAVAALAALFVGAVAIALCVSRVAGQRAVFVFYIAVVSYLAVTAAADAVVASPGQTSVLTPLNPFLALRAVLSPSAYAAHSPEQLENAAGLARLWYGNAPVAFLSLAALSSLFLVTVSVWSVRSAAIQGLSVARAQPDDDAPGQTRHPRHVGNNPIAWREAASRGGIVRQFTRWGFLAAGVLWALGLLAFFHSGALSPDDFRFALLATLQTEYLVIALVAIVSAGAAIAAEREDGALDLLLTTPITPADYLGGKLSGLVRYLAPMLAVPIITTVLAALYVAAGGLGGPSPVVTQRLVGTVNMDVPVILPVAALVAPLASVPFIAFCAVIGLQWSLRSKGVVTATVASFGVLAAVAGVLGMCGWQAGADIALLGPALSALTPVTAAYTCVDPAVAARATLEDAQTAGAATIPLLIGAAAAAALYTALTWAVKTSMTKSFDMTVRKLAGTR